MTTEVMERAAACRYPLSRRSTGRALFRGLLLTLFIFSSNSKAADETATSSPKLRVTVTLPEFAEMAQAIGGDAVSVTALLKGIEDPHMIDTTPSLILKLMKSDLVVSAGLGLESAWLNRALSKTGRPAIQRGGPGNVELGGFIEVLERPQGAVDRSQGDVHSEGNPHFNLSPRALSQASEGLEKALLILRPEMKAQFEAGRKKFVAEMVDIEKATREILKDRASNRLVIEYHREFVYFFSLYGLTSAGSIEEKPGLSPSSGRLAEVSMSAKSRNVTIAIGGTFAPRQHMRRFSELSGVPFAIVPTMVSTAASTTASPSEPASNTIRSVQRSIAEAIARSTPSK
jgi:zinc/manganese transport system substrate-binding protein